MFFVLLCFGFFLCEQETTIKNDEVPRLICIAFYMGARDYINVHFLSLIAPDEETAKVKLKPLVGGRLQ